MPLAALMASPVGLALNADRFRAQKAKPKELTTKRPRNKESVN